MYSVCLPKLSVTKESIITDMVFWKEILFNIFVVSAFTLDLGFNMTSSILLSLRRKKKERLV